MLIKFLNGRKDEEITDLLSADLRYANLSFADLSFADLRAADLCYTDLRSANLRYANLSSANLSFADLRAADLCYTDLRSADLRYANLSSANLSFADLRAADLRSADLSDTKGLASWVIAPPLGEIIGWKKLNRNVIARIRVPVDAKRVNAYGSRKCRAEFAYVDELSSDGTHFSQHDSKTAYTVGQIVLPDSFDPDPRIECSHGIHFFITREEAEEY